MALCSLAQMGWNLFLSTSFAFGKQLVKHSQRWPKCAYVCESLLNLEEYFVQIIFSLTMKTVEVKYLI